VPSPVIKGSSSSCTAIPAAGWQVSGWTGACAATGANAQCYLPTVQKNENATVSFVPLPQNTYSVTTTVALGLGSVTCSPGSVASGGASTCTAIPANGYQVSAWGGACSNWGSNAQCFLPGISSNQVSTVSFALLPVGTFTISATVGNGGGTVSCTPTSVNAGGTITCTAVPNPGYKVANWTGACASAGKNATCVINNVISDQVASVNFVKATPPPNPIPVLPIWGAALMGLGLLAAARRRF
jgi:MYXO-CTERM domain-containing protein